MILKLVQGLEGSVETDWMQSPAVSVLIVPVLLPCGRLRYDALVELFSWVTVIICVFSLAFVDILGLGAHTANIFDGLFYGPCVVD